MDSQSDTPNRIRHLVPVPVVMVVRVVIARVVIANAARVAAAEVRKMVGAVAWAEDMGSVITGKSGAVK